MLVNYEDIPQITCDLSHENVWFESRKTYADSDGRTMPNKFNCHLARGVSLLTIKVDDLYEAGTDSSIQISIYQGGKQCSTDVLDNRYNDLGRNSDNIYHTDLLGNCRDFTIDLEDNEDVFLAIQNSGSDALVVKFIKFVVRSQMEIVQMKCSLPVQGISVENSSTQKFHCRRFNIPFYANDRVSAIGLTTGSKDYLGNTEGGGGSSGPILVHLESYGEKCVTYAMRHLKNSKTTKIKEDLLNTCEGFQIENNEVNIFIENLDGDSVGVEGNLQKTFLPINKPLQGIAPTECTPSACMLPCLHACLSACLPACLLS